MMILMALALLAAQATTTADDRPILWRDFRAGMTQAEVKAMDRADFNLTPECRTAIRHRYDNQGKLVAVTLKQTGGYTKCDRVVLASLQAKYGVDGLYQALPLPYGQVHTVDVWALPTMMVSFSSVAWVDNGPAQNWTVEYEYRQPRDESAAAKL